jgi:hypothetical protein
MFSPAAKVGCVKYGEQGLKFGRKNTEVDDQVWQELGKIAEHSLAKKTWNTYNTAERMLARFHKEKGMPLELPVSEKATLEFVHWLIFERNLSAASIGGYLAGVKKLHTVKGLPEPILRSSLVKMVLEGKKNLEASGGQKGDKRQAVSPAVMGLLKIRIHQWNESMENKLMVWAVCSLLFHGAFRGAELLVRNSGTFDPDYSTLREDICMVIDGTEKRVVQVRVKAPKESKNGAGVIVDVFQTDSNICPVRAVGKWLTATEHMDGNQPAFRFTSGVPLTSAKLNNLLREWLGGVVPGISTHSFRIGAASLMGRLGFADKDVKAIGRWGSRAFEGYMRLPRTKRKLVAEKLAKHWKEL